MKMENENRRSLIIISVFRSSDQRSTTHSAVGLRSVEAADKILRNWPTQGTICSAENLLTN